MYSEKTQLDILTENIRLMEEAERGRPLEAAEVMEYTLAEGVVKEYIDPR
jgi:hypothetical protein